MADIKAKKGVQKASLKEPLCLTNNTARMVPMIKLIICYVPTSTSVQGRSCPRIWVTGVGR
jgi:hypothetical protein